MSDNPLAALAMRERAAQEVDCGGCNGDCPMPHTCCATDARAIRALPTTFTAAELLAAAMQLPEVRALIESAKAQLQYMDLCNDKGDLERNLRAAIDPFMKGGE